jgi:P27 family predicted phage terminase small subunit
MNFRRAPSHLSKEAKSWWKLIFNSYEMDESGAFILRQALECYDRLLQARAAIEEKGISIQDPLTKQLRQNPALKTEKEARSGLLQAWRLMRIDIEPPKPTGRPPGDGGPHRVNN